MQKLALIFSCEHASNHIPKTYRHLFAPADSILQTHKAWDPGVQQITQNLTRHFGAKAVYGQHSRLLIDLNRSENNPFLFSKFTKTLPAPERLQLLQTYHRPHWTELRKLVQKNLSRGKCVVHIAVHSFTPVLRGNLRQADIGLLFDPAHKMESEFCKNWQRHLRQLSDLKIKRNYPYLGKNNSLPTHFRGEFPPAQYIGVELEINQKHLRSPKAVHLMSKLIQDSLVASLT